MRSRQLGLSGGLVAVILLIIAGVLVAAQVITRIGSTSRGEARVQARWRMRRARSSSSSPRTSACLARQTHWRTMGSKLPAAPAATCTHPLGTLPWQTIGLARSDSIDTWGQKISYRVYTGAAGSLTQVEGTSMVKCDTSDAGSATAVVAGSGGICFSNDVPTVKVWTRNTSPANFLAGKGLSVYDLAAPVRTGVAYVLVSHGPSGLGGYTASGVQRGAPTASEEIANTMASGAANAPFVPRFHLLRDQAVFGFWHRSGVECVLRRHRRVSRRLTSSSGRGRVRARLARRYDHLAGVFQANVAAAVGHGVTPGSGVGQVTVTFTGVVATGVVGVTRRRLRST
jgi:hypothetical protein